MSAHAERRALQIAIVLFALIPIGAGALGVVYGPAAFEGAGAVSHDSHVRYLSGLLLGIGLAFWSFVPSIERRTTEARLLTAIVFVGGLARALSLVELGAPSTPMLGGLAMELFVTPLLCLWQSRIARLCAGETH